MPVDLHHLRRAANTPVLFRANDVTEDLHRFPIQRERWPADLPTQPFLGVGNGFGVSKEDMSRSGTSGVDNCLGLERRDQLRGHHSPYAKALVSPRVPAEQEAAIWRRLTLSNGGIGISVPH